MADFSFIFDESKGFSDYKIENGDFVLGDDLQTAVEMSLFTDRRATDNELSRIQTGKDRVSRRGYWGNSFKKYVQGSGLWTYDRAGKSQSTLDGVKQTLKEAVQWMITEGIVESFNIEASFDNEALVILVPGQKPDGQGEFKYKFAWNKWS